MYTDSVATTGLGALLAGSYADNVFGKVTANSFFEITPPALSTVSMNAVFDSLVLILRPNKSYYGDTTKSTRLSVYQLTNQETFPSGQTLLYNTTSFPVNPVALGNITTLISPGATDSVFIRLSDVTGQQLFDLYKAQDYVMQSTPNFINYFKGLELSADSASTNVIYGFSDSVIVRLHYHESDLFTENRVLDFRFYNNDNTQFIQVKTNTTGTALSVFNNTNKEVPAAALNNKAYLQYLTGFVTKIKFPTLRSLALRPDYVKILKAELTVKPLQNTYPFQTPLPPQLLAYPTDVLNGYGSPLSYVSTSGYQTGSLVTDPLFGENTYYTYDVTSYLQQQILIGYANQDGLLLSSVSHNTLDRLVIGDPKNTNTAVQLKLYYVSVNP